MRSGSWFVTVLLLTSCRAPLALSSPAAAATESPPPITEYTVKETRLLDGRVKVRVEIPPVPVGAKPTVIAFVGDTGALLGAGFNVVSYVVQREVPQEPPSPPAESPEAGQAVGTWVLASPSAAVLGQVYLRDVARQATEIVPAVVDWLTTLPEVDAARLGMVGGSTNGFVALQAAAVEPRLRAVVAIAACGQYECFLRHSSMGMRGEPLRLSPTYADWVRARDITRTPQRVVHSAILMLNRTGDQLIPFPCAEATAHRLAAAYARAGLPSRFRFVRFDVEGHGIGPDESRATLDWLRRWLPARSR
jgi:X-Pro dipeptidyl-peptidase (S15 family)